MEQDFELMCCIKHETDAAILIDTGVEEVWIPLSQISSIHHKDRDGLDRVVMSQWIAKKKGLC